MMFFEGYIGAPPTVTVCSLIGACAGPAAPAAKASAATATAVDKIEGFMSLSPCAVRAARAAAHGDTKRVRRRCARAQIFRASECGSLQTREFAAGDHRSGRLPGGRPAGRLERDCKRRVRGKPVGEIGRDRKSHRLPRVDEPE